MSDQLVNAVRRRTGATESTIVMVQQQSDGEKGFIPLRDVGQMVEEMMESVGVGSVDIRRHGPTSVMFDVGDDHLIVWNVMANEARKAWGYR